MIRMLTARIFADRSVWALPVAAFALTSAIGLMVFAGSMYFFTLDEYLRDWYMPYAIVALILLVPGTLSLMSSAARLMARRRDERLASLRLLGASSGQLRRLVIAESVTLAAAGTGAGVLLYVALMPVVGLIPFAGVPMGVSGLWLGWALLGVGVVVLLLFALVAAFAGTRRIEITPLGVRTRRSAQRVWWGRAGLAVAGTVLVLGLYHLLPAPVRQAVPFLGVVLAFATVAVPFLAVQLIGPWVLKAASRRHLRHAKTAERLIAARSVLESPQQMWRQIGGIAMVTFIGVIAGSGMGALLAADQQHMAPLDRMLMGDIQRGVWVTLGVAFLMTACSVGINQTAQLLDRRTLYVSLHRMGMGADQLNRSAGWR